MNLRVFTPKKFDVEGNVVSEETSRVLHGLTDLHVEFIRNTATVTHRMTNGALVTETFELHRLFSEGNLADYVFGLPGDEVSVESAIGNLTDPTTMSTASITNPTGGVVRQAEVTRIEPTGNQGLVGGTEPHKVEVPAATDMYELKRKLASKNNPDVAAAQQETNMLVVPDPTATRQGPTNAPIVNP